MKRRILAFLTCFALIIGAGFLILNSPSPKEANAATRTSQLKVGGYGYTYISNTTPISGSSTSYIDVKFDISAVTYGSSSPISFIFDLTPNFGTITSAANGGNGVEMTMPNADQCIINATYNQAMSTNPWSYWLSKDGGSATQYPTTGGGVPAGGSGGIWIDFTGAGVKQYAPLTVIVRYDFSAKSFTISLYDGSTVKWSFAIGSILNISPSLNYYPTIVVYKPHANDSITIDNFSVTHGSTIVNKTTFSNPGDICTAHPFSAPFCIVGGTHSIVQTGTIPTISVGSHNVRLSGKVGTRYVAKVNTTHYNSLVSEFGESNISRGMILISGDLLSGNKNFTIETCSSPYSTGAINVNCTKWYGSLGTFNCVLTDIPTQNYDTHIAVKPYIKVVSNGETYVFYGSMFASSLEVVAGNTWKDRSNTKTGSYIYQTEEGDYSPYTQTQLDSLYTYYRTTIQNAYDSYWMQQHDSGIMPLGAFIPPTVATNFNDYDRQFNDIATDANYKTYAESGLNLALEFSIRKTVLTNEEDFNRRLGEVLGYCEKYDISLMTMVGNSHQTSNACTSVANTKSVLSYDSVIKNYDSWGGFVVMDEPPRSRFTNIKNIRNYYDQISVDTLPFCNLWPSYATYGLLSGTSDSTAATAEQYSQYVLDFITNFRPKVLCMDYYPLFNDNTHRQYYFANLYEMRVHAKNNGIPFWSYINLIDHLGLRAPSQADVNWCVNAALVYGAKGILYFTYVIPAQTSFYSGGMVDLNGNKTAQYTYVQNINNHISTIDHVLMRSNFKAIISLGTTPNVIPDSSGSAYGNMSLISGDLIAGCFDHKGKETYYVMDNRLGVSGAQATSMSLGSKSGYYIHNGTWYSFSGTINVSTNPGDGILVVCN